MKVETDIFSGNKIYPGKGKLYIQKDSKLFRFVGSKTEALSLQKKNPRKISWTQLYRRAHKKGITEEVAKKRTRRTVKHQRAIVGASWDTIRQRRYQKQEVREAARDAAKREAKEKKKEEETKKREKKRTLQQSTRAGPKVTKQQNRGHAPKVSSKTR